MDRKKLVSVIVPIYNAEKYLNRCIDSILRQKHQNFELILVDDGSTDRSGSLCDEYVLRDNRIKVIHKSNGGVSSARNAGLHEAKGQVIMFVDSDDWLTPDHITELLPIGNEDFVYGGYDQYDHGKFIAPHVPESKTMTLSEIKNDFFSLLLKQYSFYYVWCCCYKAAIIKEQNLFFSTDAKIGEDMLFNIQYLTNCQLIRFVSSQTYCHDGVDNSLVRRYYPNRLDKERNETILQESFAGYKGYYMRWFNWHTAIFHYQAWINRKTGSEKKEVQRQLDKCFSDPYFRECLPYIRKRGSLDEKIKTLFMYRKLYPLFDPIYSCVIFLSKIKNSIFKKKIKK